MDVFVNVISTLGFPIAVAAFALWNSHEHEKYLQGVLENTLKENTAAINKLSDLIERVTIVGTVKGVPDEH